MSYIQEAIREWAWVVGQDRPDLAWILSDYDTWERNPHYTGPEQRHPEDYDYDEEDIDDEPFEMSDVEADADTLASAGYGTDEDYICDNDYCDDIPF